MAHTKKTPTATEAALMEALDNLIDRWPNGPQDRLDARETEASRMACAGIVNAQREPEPRETSSVRMELISAECDRCGAGFVRPLEPLAAAKTRSETVELCGNGSGTTFPKSTMKARSDTTGILEAALEYADLGWPIIPLNGKVPALPGWQQFAATPENVGLWFRPGRNVGLRTGDSCYIVVDTDTAEAEDWVLHHLPETPMMALSGAGSRHRYYRRPPRKEIRNKQAWHGIQGLDIRGHGGFIVLPPSLHPATGRPYRWLTEPLPPKRLPAFDAVWTYQRPRPVTVGVADTSDMNHLLIRGRKYVDTFDRRAISGQGGHDALFVASLKIATFAHRDRDVVWQLLLYFNATKCDPPWDLAVPADVRALRHKLDDALRLAH